MSALDALARAHASLEGLALGDAFGDRLFFDNYTFQRDAAEEPFADRRLPAGRWAYTDDTQMALSVVETLARHGRVDSGRPRAQLRRAVRARPRLRPSDV